MSGSGGDPPGSAPQFRFVQLELPWALGPADGRYVLRPHAGEDAEHVLVLGTLGAQQRAFGRGRRRGRARAVAPGPEPTAVLTARATLVDAQPLPDEESARAWLDGADREALVGDALRTLNRVLHLHRIAAADPSARDVTREQALTVRVGYGAGEQVADGRYARALELPAPAGARTRRDAVLRPQERLAALLGGRDVALACEELTLRARDDVGAGRLREGALTLRVALETALAELEAWAERRDLRQRLQELATLRPEAVRVSDRALEGGLDDADAETVERVLGRVEAALRARTSAELGGVR